MFGPATPPDGAGPIGPEQVWPQPIKVTPDELLRSLNPLHHIPLVGMFYRAVTGETIPAPLRVAGSGLIGGPLSALGTAFMCLVEELVRMGPDLSRPSTPAGMAQTGSERGMEPVTPGTLGDGAYLTLATSTPEFLQNHTPDTAIVQNGAAVYQQASMEWQRSQALEKGIV